MILDKRSYERVCSKLKFMIMNMTMIMIMIMPSLTGWGNGARRGQLKLKFIIMIMIMIMPSVTGYDYAYDYAVSYWLGGMGHTGGPVGSVCW